MSSRIFLTILILLLTPLWGIEQSGVVRSGGLAIPGATVTATQGEKKLVTTTDESGRYIFANLPAGAWTLRVEMFGFSPATREVRVDERPSAADWTLALKPLSEPAPVSKAAQEARPAQAPAGRGRGGDRAPAQGPGGPNGRGGFRNLSLNDTAEAQDPAALDAALRPADANAPADAAANANEAFLVNGSLSTGLDAPGQQGPFFPRDGAGFGLQQFGGDPNNPNGPGFAGGQGPDGQPVPGGPAGGPGGPGRGGRGFGPGGPGGPGGGFGGRGGGGGFGRGGGFGDGRGGGRGGFRQRPGEASFGNRRGGGRNNTIRGGANLQLGNSAFDARPLSLNGQTLPKSSYGSGSFGFILGGPLFIPKIIHNDKWTFNLNYRGMRSRTSFNSLTSVPTALERSGDFSQSFAAGPVTLYDPVTRTPLPGNKIPAGQLNSAALGLLQYVPLPNQPGSVQNYQILNSIPSNSDQFGLVLNRVLTSKDRLNGNFNYQRADRLGEQTFGYKDDMTSGGLSLALGWSHTLGGRSVNNLRWNFSRARNQTVPFFAYQTDVAAALGIKGTSNDPINWGPPNLSFTNYGALNDASPATVRNQTSSLAESVLFTRKSHNLSIGGEFRRLQFNTLTDSNARGSFVFSGLGTSLLDASGQPVAGTGYDFADFLLGLPQQSSVRFGASDTYFRGSVYTGFVNDDWRLRSNLTVNIGLRYEYFAPLTEKYNRLANLDIAPGFTAVAVVTPGKPGPYTGDFPNALVEPDKNNFSPRVGIAWRPTRKGRLLVRSGYGIFYNGSIYSSFTRQLGSQPPFAASSGTLTTSLAEPLTLQNGFPTQPSSIITNTYAIDRNYALGYAQTWNLNVQREFPHSIVVELGYLGTKGTRLDIQRLPNRAAPGSPLTAEQRRQIGDAQGFTFESSEGNSIYHALQTRVTRRMQRGIAVFGTYTFGKSIDNASTFGGGGATVAQNDKDLRAERGLSSFDHRQALSMNWVLESPVGKGAFLPDTGMAGRLLKDWALSGGITAQSGSPFTARVLGNQSNSGGTGSVGSGRADATGLPIGAVLPGQFFNPAAFAIPVAGTFGDASRNTIIGPGTVVANLSLMRSFQLGDSRRRINISVNGQNFLNHSGITGIGTVINSSTYGLATSAQKMRSVTLALRLNF